MVKNSHKNLVISLPRRVGTAIGAKGGHDSINLHVFFCKGPHVDLKNKQIPADQQKSRGCSEVCGRQIPGSELCGTANSQQVVKINNPLTR